MIRRGIELLSDRQFADEVVFSEPCTEATPDQSARAFIEVGCEVTRIRALYEIPDFPSTSRVRPPCIHVYHKDSLVRNSYCFDPDRLRFNFSAEDISQILHTNSPRWRWIQAEREWKHLGNDSALNDAITQLDRRLQQRIRLNRNESYSFFDNHGYHSSSLTAIDGSGERYHTNIDSFPLGADGTVELGLDDEALNTVFSMSWAGGTDKAYLGRALSADDIVSTIDRLIESAKSSREAGENARTQTWKDEEDRPSADIEVARSTKEHQSLRRMMMAGLWAISGTLLAGFGSGQGGFWSRVENMIENPFVLVVGFGAGVFGYVLSSERSR